MGGDAVKQRPKAPHIRSIEYTNYAHARKRIGIWRVPIGDKRTDGRYWTHDRSHLNGTGEDWWPTREEAIADLERTLNARRNR